MKKAVKIGLVLFGFAALVIGSISVTSANGGDAKVLVNHNNRVICISLNAVSGHLEHGDTIVSDGTIGDDSGL